MALEQGGRVRELQSSGVAVIRPQPCEVWSNCREQGLCVPFLPSLSSLSGYVTVDFWGVLLPKVEQFFKVNGFSNNYWGWGRRR